MPSDSKACAVLLTELGYPNTDVFVQEKLKQLANGEKDRVFVAVVRGEVIGFASCHVMPLIHEEHNLCRVTALVVARDYRRKNVATQLMSKVEAYARKSGCGRIEITSGIQRQDAHLFYEHIGYAEASRRFQKRLGEKKE